MKEENWSDKMNKLMKKIPLGDENKKITTNERNVSMLRQWINEDVAKEDRLITNEDIIEWLT